MAELPFLIDRRDKLAGRAMTHALFIGVGAYRDDSIPDLPTGAFTAVTLLRRIIEADEKGRLAAPLGTATVLISPTDDERAALTVDEEKSASANFANICAALRRLKDLMLEQEKTCDTPDPQIGSGLVIFYFGGHGADLGTRVLTGFASDADFSRRPWHGALDFEAYIRDLTEYGSDSASRSDETVMRIFFVNDNCRTRDDFDFENPEEVLEDWKKPLSSPKGVRPNKCLSPSAGFPAYEPVAPNPLPPDVGMPLSCIGQALWHVLFWFEEAGDTCVAPWCATTSGIAARLPPCIKELAKAGGICADLLTLSYRGDGGEFPLMRSDVVSKARILYSCDPADMHLDTSLEIERHGPEALEPETRIDAPWTNHPLSGSLVPGLFQFTAQRRGSTFASSDQRLRLAVGEWICEVKDDGISVQDPAR